MQAEETEEGNTYEVHTAAPKEGIMGYPAALGWCNLPCIQYVQYAAQSWQMHPHRLIPAGPEKATVLLLSFSHYCVG